MKLFLLSGLGLLIVLFSCKSKTAGSTATPDSPMAYNERVEELEEGLDEPMLKAEAEIKVRSDKGDFAGMAQSAKAIEDSIDLRIHTLQKTDPVGKGGADFKTVVVRYFEYLKSIYTAYRNIAEAATDAAKDEAAEHMSDILKAQADVVTNLKLAQQKYAVDNAFVIE